MKKTRAQRTIRLDDGRDPGSIALWRDRFEQPEVGPEMMDNTPEFFEALSNKASVDILGTISDQSLNLCFEDIDLLFAQRYFDLPLDRPAVGPIEGAGNKVSRKKRDRVEAQHLGGVHRLPEISVVEPLDGSASCYRKGGIKLTQGVDPGSELLESPTDPSDLVVNLGRTIQRHDDIVDRLGDTRRISFEQQTGRQNRRSDWGLYTKVTKGIE